ncbi:hypothetical protein Bbelb_376420 [Branchiostoma belcheri]|nr:hypothetical protein Bbelb_376420 [Branchiostoma belcheri]
MSARTIGQKITWDVPLAIRGGSCTTGGARQVHLTPLLSSNGTAQLTSAVGGKACFRAVEKRPWKKTPPDSSSGGTSRTMDGPEGQNETGMDRPEGQDRAGTDGTEGSEGAHIDETEMLAFFSLLKCCEKLDRDAQNRT